MKKELKRKGFLKNRDISDKLNILLSIGMAIAMIIMYITGAYIQKEIITVELCNGIPGNITPSYYQAVQGEKGWYLNRNLSLLNSNSNFSDQD